MHQIKTKNLILSSSFSWLEKGVKKCVDNKGWMNISCRREREGGAREILLDVYRRTTNYKYNDNNNYYLAL